jgi:hypothetical protein
MASMSPVKNSREKDKHKVGEGHPKATPNTEASTTVLLSKLLHK